MKRTSRESRRRQSLETENDELKNMVERLQERLKMTTTRSGVSTTSLSCESENGSDVEASSAFYLPTKDDDRRMQKHGGQEQQRRHHRNHSHSPRENARVGTPRKSMQGHDAVRPDFFQNSNKKLPQGWEGVHDLIEEGEYAGWLINPKQITMLNEIGKGCEGTVYRAKWGGATVAVKNVGARNAKQAKALVRSTEISVKLRHPNVLPLLGAYFNPFGDSCLMFPVMLVGTMKQWLYSDLEKGGVGALFGGGATKSKAHKYKKRLKAAWDVAKGMSYLEDMFIMHRDLKPSNIFMKSSAKGCAVIADFGLARYSSLKDNESTPTACTGTFIYMAPEVITGKWYDTKCDVFSFGVLLNELLDRKAPYSGSYYSPQQIARAVVEQNMRPKVYSNDNSRDSKRLVKLTEKCWVADPNVRPSFAEIINEMDAIMPSLGVEDSPESFPGTGDFDADQGRESVSNSRESVSNTSSPGSADKKNNTNPILGSLNKVLEAFF